MILRCRELIGNLLAGVEADSWPHVADAADEAAPAMSGALVVIPWLMVFLAVGVAIWFMVRWCLRGCHDPLVDAPSRPHTLAEDAVLVAIGVYFLAVSLLSLIALETMKDAQGTVASILIGSGGQFIGGTACLLIAQRRFMGGWKGLLFGAPADIQPVQLLNADIAEYGDRQHSVPGGSHETEQGEARGLGGGIRDIAQGEACGSGFIARGEERRAGHSNAVGVTVVTLILAVGLCPLIAEWTAWLYHALRPDDGIPLHPTLVALGSGAEPWYAVAMLWLGAALIAPAAEELFFRGLLQTWLGDRLRSRWRAIGLTAIAFGLVHTGQPQAIPALVALAVLLGFAYERTGMVIVPITVHAGFNLNTLIWQAVSTPGA